MRSSGSLPSAAAGGPLRIGMVRLVDAAPLIAARDLGYFAAAGLRVRLLAQIGWGNIRDKLTFGMLDCSHALLGMAPLSQLAEEGRAEPLVNIMSLGTGGNTITLSQRLVGQGVHSAATFARHVRNLGGREPPALAHVFACSTQHYLLRRWLAAAGLDPDVDVRLCILPPPQMVAQMRRGWLEGFCAGEPWGSLAAHAAVGRMVAATSDVIPDHPEKVLAVRRRWLEANQDLAAALVRAILLGCRFCEDPANHPALARMLARTGGVEAPVDLLAASLAASDLLPQGGTLAPRVPPFRFRSFAPRHAFPSATHVAWLLQEMVRWRHLPPQSDVWAVAAKSVDTRPFRAAAAELAVACPADDFPPLVLPEGALRRETVEERAERPTMRS